MKVKTFLVLFQYICSLAHIKKHSYGFWKKGWIQVILNNLNILFYFNSYIIVSYYAVGKWLLNNVSMSQSSEFVNVIFLGKFY